MTIIMCFVCIYLSKDVRPSYPSVSWLASQPARVHSSGGMWLERCEYAIVSMISFGILEPS